MKRVYSSSLQILVVLFGIVTLVFLLWEPHVEGVHAHDAFFDVYFNDPFLVYAYVSSIAFFIALYQLFKLAGYLGENELPVQRSVKALQTIQYCAIVMPVFIVIGLVWLLQTENDDKPPLLMMATITIFISIAIATAAARFQKKLHTH